MSVKTMCVLSPNVPAIPSVQFLSQNSLKVLGGLLPAGIWYSIKPRCTGAALAQLHRNASSENLLIAFVNIPTPSEWPDAPALLSSRSCPSCTGLVDRTTFVGRLLLEYKPYLVLVLRCLRLETHLTVTVAGQCPSA